MLELLARWNELEPRRCARSANGTQLIPRPAMQILGSAFYALPTGGLLSAVIEAVEEHEWDWALTSAVEHATQNRTHMATAGHASGRGDSPEHALLAAYLGALEKMRGES